MRCIVWRGGEGRKLGGEESRIVVKVLFKVDRVFCVLF